MDTIKESYVENIALKGGYHGTYEIYVAHIIWRRWMKTGPIDIQGNTFDW